ncbi:major capsid protein [Micromonospora sp. NBC_01655]|uniref:major capsid protein n=1 Tax=Micromonospora sp. NBC_01655 TaxID=2975983 RepID=UPI00224DD51E|nr:major capsid protein [Micromonospora sp. NBC_01655]MCX4470459.1 major capsid protein [Micromonospora sp. NBC_01655]
MATMALELTDPEELTLAARQIPFPAGILQRWLPSVTRRDHRYLFRRSARSLRRAIPFRPWNTPAVPLDRGEMTEVTGRMLPLSGILWLLEEDSQLLDVARAAGDEDAIAEVFDQDLLTLTRGALQRVMLAQGEAIWSGKVTVGTAALPENRLQLGAVDFGLPAQNFTTAPTLWNGVTPDVFGQLDALTTTYRNTTGQEVNPGVILMSTRIKNVLLKDPDFRNLLGSMIGAPPSIGTAQLRQLFVDRELPRLIVDDTAVPDHTGVMRRQIPDDRIVILPEEPGNEGGMPVGQTQWGTTEEAKKLVRAQALGEENAPGLVAVAMESENPVHTGTLVAGIAMPVVTDPDLIMSVKVL